MKFLRIEDIDPVEDHWDITVEKNNNFYANGVLVHNSNGSVCFNTELGFWIQSKTDIIEIGKDNAGCAFANSGLESQWMEIINALATEHNIDLDEKIISVYFEWCGKGIQKNTAVEGLEKMAMIFAYFKVSPKVAVLEEGDDPNAEDKVAFWLPTLVDGKPVSNEEVNIFNIQNFPSYEFEIDFAPHMAKMSQNKMVDVVLNTIEPSSPVGKTMYNMTYGGIFNKKGGKYDKDFPHDIKEKLTPLADGEYTLEF